MGKKKKRLTLCKKAVYKYRFQKKQYLINNIFHFDKQNSTEIKMNNKSYDNNYINIIEEDIKNEELESQSNYKLIYNIIFRHK